MQNISLLAKDTSSGQSIAYRTKVTLFDCFLFICPVKNSVRLPLCVMCDSDMITATKKRLF